MKKMTLSVILLFLISAQFAQFQAPEILGLRDYFTAPEQCASIYMFCNEITAPNFDHYEFYWDGEYVDEWNFPNMCYMFVDFTLYSYHTAGVKAIYSTGESEISSINFYLSEPFYDVPQNLTLTNDFNNSSVLFQWEEPEMSGSDPPVPLEYDIYLDGDLIATSSELSFTFENMVYGQSYVVGIAVNYSDGHTSQTFHPILTKELYYCELDPPEQITIDDMEGILSWQNPDQGDIIGGSIMNLVAPMMWPTYWPVADQPATLGDSTNFVNLMWSLASWNHSQAEDRECIWIDNANLCAPTLYASTDATNITQLNNALSLNYSEDSVYLYDGDTSLDGYGDFVALFNSDSGYYGVFQLLDVDAFIEEFNGFSALNFHASWWFQTNGSDDFSDAPRYFPLYYNIYLDGELIDCVSYELIVNDYGMPLVVDPLLLPTNQFEYQFENLVGGQDYVVDIEAVYRVGTASPQTIEFTYGGAEAGNPLLPVTKLIGNYPNPFNPETIISFSTTNSDELTQIQIYNLKGQKVKQLVNCQLEAGHHSAIWNGTDETGKTVSSGVYFYKMNSGNFHETRKMILMK
ncbi:MAG: T9SS type A sorting domain-containing protein [Candidatus Cloacimonetes bacterium]|nr:T9SS type A sorting domain-containing protein [Candidatus Cloacimonadota bacterium]MCF7814663.1 T9SS type A sorting domain-containing protein [Candidatus Cloacimonadota bacterium]MCF7869338.1 T9SS type A sorting domain-containing protein [Candidatus Cloacimonadota bacterium]MCF7884551.1 T9SS type A sorting domain-containing protein [Candidatus Cloacimonadota bacterium]